MKIFPANKVQEIDAYTIEHEPIKSIDLMERAALKLTEWFVKRIKTDRKIIIIAGPGNNGGDALAMARMLIERRYTPKVYFISSSGKLSADCRTNLDRLHQTGIGTVYQISSPDDFPEAGPGDVVVDGVFGSGLSRVVEGLYKSLLTHINQSEASIISIDIPSGLFGEDNSTNNADSIIHASYTLTFQFPFLSFMFADNVCYVGEWHVLDIGLHPGIIENTASKYTLLERQEIAGMFRERKKFDHKGNYGHALCIAGSFGMMGAAVLSGKAAIRSGAGLVTLHVPVSGYEIVQIAVPEVIVSVDKDDDCFSTLPDFGKFTAIAIGPGLGKEKKSAKALNQLMKEVKVPLVIDADALNLLSEDDEELSLPEHTILTPHPGEFDRLFGNSNSAWERHEKQLFYAKELNVIIVLKGANSGIAFPDGSYFFNATGNPGMATGGSGDVLTGILVSLLAKGMTPENAALAGVFLHGMAGDMAAEEMGEESLIARDISRNLGNAFKKILSNPFLHEGRTGGIIQ